LSAVVVTGLGCVTPLGPDVPSFAEGIFAGRCGIGPITRFDASAHRIRVAAEARGFDAACVLGAREAERLDRVSQMAVVASREAAASAGLAGGAFDRSRCAVVLGTGVGGQESLDDGYRRLYGEGSARLHPLTVPRMMPSAPASHVGLDLGVTGPALGTVSACASAAHAIALGAMLLRAGMADVAIVGGAEACITPGSFRAWEGLRVMAADACRPFSAGRGGIVIGEGAGVLVLETEAHARARAAPVLAELAGVGLSSDAHDLVQPSPEGMARAMELALRDAGLERSDVDYVHAHGTGTGQNDAAETDALRRVFGPHADRLAVSSTKSMTGHLLGASAALGAIAAVLAIRRATAPPTIGYLGPDPACDLDYVPCEARALPIGVAVANAFAFGGLNGVLVFRRGGV